MNKLRPNGQRAKNAILLIWIVFALAIVGLVSNYFQYNLVHTVAKGGYVSLLSAKANDIRVRIIAIFSFIANLISAITFIMWFRRAYYNLHQKVVGSLSCSDGWAAGSWFVPIVSLYRPYQIMREIYVETEALFDRKGLSEKISYTTTYLGWWWAFWIITNIIGTIIVDIDISIKQNTVGIGSYIALTITSMIENISYIPLAIITVKVIKDYSKVEPLLNEISDDDEQMIPNNQA